MTTRYQDIIERAHAGGAALGEQIMASIRLLANEGNRPREIHIHPADWRTVKEDMYVKLWCRYPTDIRLPPGTACLFMGVPLILDEACPQMVKP